MQLINRFNKGICFLLCVCDIFSKYAWVTSLKGKKETTITNDFQKILYESSHKPNKIWVDKASEFYSKSKKPVVRTLKNKLYKYMTLISKNVYIDKLDNIVNKYNNKYHRIIKIKHVDIKPSMYIDFNKEKIKEIPKFKVDDNVRTSKYKNIFLQKAMFLIDMKKFCA